MQRTSNLVLPYDPAYRAHWEAKERRNETRKWLEQRKQHLPLRQHSPSVVPDVDAAAENDHIKTH
jgi:hypothetical protein